MMDDDKDFEAGQPVPEEVRKITGRDIGTVQMEEPADRTAMQVLPMGQVEVIAQDVLHMAPEAAMRMDIRELVGKLGEVVLQQRQTMNRMSDDNVQIAEELAIYEERVRNMTKQAEEFEPMVQSLRINNEALSINGQQLAQKLQEANAVIAAMTAQQLAQDEANRVNAVQQQAMATVLGQQEGEEG